MYVVCCQLCCCCCCCCLESQLGRCSSPLQRLHNFSTKKTPSAASLQLKNWCIVCPLMYNNNLYGQFLFEGGSGEGVEALIVAGYFLYSFFFTYQILLKCSIGSVPPPPPKKKIRAVAEFAPDNCKNFCSKRYKTKKNHPSKKINPEKVQDIQFTDVDYPLPSVTTTYEQQLFVTRVS